MRKELLLLDGIGNVFLGLLLLVAPTAVAGWLGLVAGDSFYANLFGAVLIGHWNRVAARTARGAWPDAGARSHRGVGYQSLLRAGPVGLAGIRWPSTERR